MYAQLVLRATSPHFPVINFIGGAVIGLLQLSARQS
jgi:hypothetical protein